MSAVASQKVGDRACACQQCVRLCERNPGWFTPAEARQAIEAGHARMMMRDWLTPSVELGNDKNIHVLAPASEFHGGQDAPDYEPESFVDAYLGNWCKGRCVFLKGGLCGLHTSGFKPVQCRTALGCEPQQQGEYPDNFEVARLWDSDEGRAVVAQWQRAVA